MSVLGELGALAGETPQVTDAGEARGEGLTTKSTKTTKTGQPDVGNFFVLFVVGNHLSLLREPHTRIAEPLSADNYFSNHFQNACSRARVQITSARRPSRLSGSWTLPLTIERPMGLSLSPMAACSTSSLPPACGFSW